MSVTSAAVTETAALFLDSNAEYFDKLKALMDKKGKYQVLQTKLPESCEEFIQVHGELADLFRDVSIARDIIFEVHCKLVLEVCNSPEAFYNAHNDPFYNEMHKINSGILAHLLQFAGIQMNTSRKVICIDGNDDLSLYAWKMRFHDANEKYHLRLYGYLEEKGLYEVLQSRLPQHIPEFVATYHDMNDMNHLMGHAHCLTLVAHAEMVRLSVSREIKIESPPAIRRVRRRIVPETPLKDLVRRSLAFDSDADDTEVSDSDVACSEE